MPIDLSEDIARAICSDQFDPATGEMSASLFKGVGTSVSRLSICPLEDTWDLFRQRVEKPPERTLERIGVINVGRLAEIGRTFTANPTALTVEAVPLEDYPSHAEIPQKISRGLAFEIVRNLMVKGES
ncbi:MAG: hypothetical protein K9N23_01390 [Akkermansiaceae bacterium]|nr:hypothetical protein [Akkermansiaceae bacterium]MCF7730304.1 hypothetical protein [Akkermansiaceae bacterium]